MLRIEAPHFTAGIIIGKKAAPIIKYMEKWDRGQIERYCFWKGWKVHEVSAFLGELLNAKEVPKFIQEKRDSDFATYFGG